MDRDPSERIVKLLEEIRDNQAASLEIVRRQSERAERLQDRAEQLQARGMGMMKLARGALLVVVPLVLGLVLYLSWLIFR